MTMIASTMAPEMSALKARLKTTWESGDYGVFARFLERGALEFFERLDLPPGTRLLDLACGAGQLTLPAARKGIDVTGLDLAANLVEQARAKAAEEGLAVHVDQGDAEELRYRDRAYDVVMSLIGVMFAPRPELVATEMLRVCRAGRTDRDGQLDARGSRRSDVQADWQLYVSPPANVPSPLLWGTEAACRDRFGAGVTDLRRRGGCIPSSIRSHPRRSLTSSSPITGPPTAPTRRWARWDALRCTAN